ncbi:prephenate dehydrogenase/arogenate dehydrogenase family protein [Thermoproteota archaeon]
MIASIIGANGKMGKWLNTHLTGLGYTITKYDERRNDSSSILWESDLVIVSVPVGVTAEVIARAVNNMKKGSTIIEIASLKAGIYEEIVRTSKKGFNALSVHPMFGPSVTSLRDKTVAVLPVIDAISEMQQVSDIFPEANIVEVKPEAHDRLMSLILSLPYLVNLALAGTIKDEDLELLKKLSGTSFALQYILIQSVVGETTSLIYALLRENQFLGDSIQKFITNLDEINEAIGSREEFERIHKKIKKPLKYDSLHMKAHIIRQKAYDIIRPLLR